MKELVYAWYPSASDALKSYGETNLSNYTKECLYRYAASRFHKTHCDGGVTEEAAGKGERDDASVKRLEEVAQKAPKMFFLPQPPSGPFPPPARSKSAVEGKLQGGTSPEPGSRPLDRVGCSSQAHRGRASSAWVKSKDWLAETNTFSGGVAVDGAAPVRTLTGSLTADRAPQVLPSSPASRVTSDGRTTRVQSAVIRRQGSQVVKRSVQSAGPERLSATLVGPAATVAEASAEGCVRRRARPRGPTPRQWKEEEEGDGSKEAVEDLGLDNPLDYDEQLKIHGWKMEIPGDPLRIKRGCIARRLPTTVIIPVEGVERKAVRSHVQSCETFFYNTIPRMPMSFTIHPDWASELLQTKRLELKPKTGTGAPRMADFSFVY